MAQLDFSVRTGNNGTAVYVGRCVNPVYHSERQERSTVASAYRAVAYEALAYAFYAEHAHDFVTPDFTYEDYIEQLRRCRNEFAPCAVEERENVA